MMGGISTQSSKTVSVQASKKTVYVITGVKTTTKQKYKKTGKLISTVTETNKLSYGKNGLLSKQVKTIGRKSAIGVKSTSSTTWAYSYDRKQRLSKSKFTEKLGSHANNRVYSYKTNSKGQVTSIVAPGSSDTEFTIKAGKVVAQSTVLTSTGEKYAGYKYSYDKNKRLSVAKREETLFIQAATTKYGYDKKGNLSSYALTFSGLKSPSQKYAFKNTYSKGRLTKRTCDGYTQGSGGGDGAYAETTSYTYKPITVSSSLASKVEAQQWAILNEDLNFALGTKVM